MRVNVRVSVRARAQQPAQAKQCHLAALLDAHVLVELGAAEEGGERRAQLDELGGGLEVVVQPIGEEQVRVCEREARRAVDLVPREERAEAGHAVARGAVGVGDGGLALEQEEAHLAVDQLHPRDNIELLLPIVLVALPG